MSKTFSARIPAAVLLGICLAVFILSVALPAQAAVPIGSTGPLVPAECRSPSNIAQTCTICHIAILVINITNYLIYWVAFPSVVILVAIGGIMILIAGPSEERQTAGKKILTSTIVGLIIVFLSWLIVDTAIKVATGNINAAGPGAFIQSFGPWNVINIPATGCPL